MECCYTRPGHQGTPFVAMSRFFYECLHKPKRTKRNNHCAIGTLANLETFSHVFFFKAELIIGCGEWFQSACTRSHVMSRSFGSPSQHASRSGLSLLHASASYCPTQFPKVLPPAQSDQLRWANEVCHEMFEDTVFSTFSGGSATFGLILLSGDDAPRGESFCGRSIPMALLTLLQICSKDHHRQL